MEFTKRFLAIGFLFCASAISISVACSAKNGWGQPEAIVLPKPTLIPKLAAAFQDGKASVAYKAGFKNIGWGAGGAKSEIFINGLGWGDNYEFGYGVNAPFTRDLKRAYQKGSASGVKGHYYTNDGSSYKSVNYDFDNFGKK